MNADNNAARRFFGESYQLRQVQLSENDSVIDNVSENETDSSNSKENQSNINQELESSRINYTSLMSERSHLNIHNINQNSNRMILREQILRVDTELNPEDEEFRIIQGSINKINNHNNNANHNAEEEDLDIVEMRELLRSAQERKDNQLEFSQTEQIYLKVVNIQSKKFGSTSQEVASTYKKIASMCQQVKKLDLALKYYKESLKILSQQNQRTSREATCLVSIASIQLSVGEIGEASDFINQALHIYSSEILEDEEMKPLLIAQALRLKRKIELFNLQKEGNQIIEPKEQSLCSICLEDIQKRHRARQLQCGHRYHIICISEWLSISPKCPYCRDTLQRPLY